MFWLYATSRGVGRDEKGWWRASEAKSERSKVGGGLHSVAQHEEASTAHRTQWTGTMMRLLHSLQTRVSIRTLIVPKEMPSCAVAHHGALLPFNKAKRSICCCSGGGPLNPGGGGPIPNPGGSPPGGGMPGIGGA